MFLNSLKLHLHKDEYACESVVWVDSSVSITALSGTDARPHTHVDRCAYTISTESTFLLSTHYNCRLHRTAGNCSCLTFSHMVSKRYNYNCAWEPEGLRKTKKVKKSLWFLCVGQRCWTLTFKVEHTVCVLCLVERFKLWPQDSSVKVNFYICTWSLG